MPRFDIDVVVNPRQAQQGARQVEQSLGRVQQRARGLGDSLTKALGFLGIAGGFVGIQQAARSVVQLLDSFTALQNRLRTVTDGTAELTAATDALFVISQDTRSSFRATAELYTRVALASRELGISQRTTLEFTKSLNQAVILSGASAQEAEAGLIQLSQGIASGTLRGDELRSVLEQLPVVSDVIAESLGVTRGELRKMGFEGRITADTIITAFGEAADDLDRRFLETIPTISQGFQVLGNEAVKLVGSYNEATGASEAIGRALVALTDGLDTVVRSVGVLATTLTVTLARRAIPAAISAIGSLTAAIAANPFGALAVAITASASALVLFSDQIPASADGLTSLADVGAGIFDALPGALSRGLAFVQGAVVPAYIEAHAAIGRSMLGLVQVVTRGLTDAVGAAVQAALDLGRRIGRGLLEAVGPVVAGLGEAFGRIGERLGAVFGDALAVVRLMFGRLASDVDQSLVGVLTVGARVADGFLGVWLGVARAIPIALDNLPQAIELVFVDALNGALSTVELFAGSVVDVVNGVREGVGLEAIQLPELDRFTASREAIDTGAAIAGALASGIRESTVLQEAVVDIEASIARLGSVEGPSFDLDAAGDRRIVPDDFGTLLALLEREGELLRRNNEQRAIAEVRYDFEDQLKRRLTDTEAALVAGIVEQNRALERQNELVDDIRGPVEALAQQQADLAAVFDQGRLTVQEYNAALIRLNASAPAVNTTLGGIEAGVARLQARSLEFGEAVSDQLVSAIDSLGNAFEGFLRTGEFRVREWAAEVAAALARIYATQLLIQAVQGAVGVVGGGGGGAGAAAGAAAGALPAARTGADWTVGGNGGTDSQLVAFRATPGERVLVQTPQQQREAAPVAPPVVNLRVVNQSDPRESVDALDTRQGEQRVLNIIRRNPAMIRRVLRG